MRTRVLPFPGWDALLVDDRIHVSSGCCNALDYASPRASRPSPICLVASRKSLAGPITFLAIVNYYSRPRESLLAGRLWRARVVVAGSPVNPIPIPRRQLPCDTFSCTLASFPRSTLQLLPAAVRPQQVRFISTAFIIAQVYARRCHGSGGGGGGGHLRSNPYRQQTT
jgi:hypothetical protein